MGEKMIRPQHGTKGEYRTWWKTGLEINPTGVSSSDAKGTGRDKVGDRDR